MKVGFKFERVNVCYGRTDIQEAVLYLDLTATRNEALEATAEKIVKIAFATGSGESQEELIKLADSLDLCRCNNMVFVTPPTSDGVNRIILDREKLTAAISKVLKNENWFSCLTEPDTFKLTKEIASHSNAE